MGEGVEGQRRWDSKNEHKHMFLQYYLPLQAFNSQLLLVLCFCLLLSFSFLFGSIYEGSDSIFGSIYEGSDSIC